MKISPILCLITVSLSAISKGSGTTDDATISSLAMGKGYAATLSLAELSDDYHAVRFKIGSEGGGLLDNYLNQAMMFGGMSAPAGQPNPMDAMTLMEDSWTKGETVRASNQEFLITYRLSVLPARGAIKSPSLKLTLLRTDSITSIAPDSSLTPAVLRQKLITITEGAGMDSNSEPTAPDSSSGSSPIGAIQAEDAIRHAAVARKIGEMSGKDNDARTYALEASSQSSAKYVAISLAIYANDYDDVLPYAQDTATVKRVTAPYIKSDAAWNTQNPAGSTWRFNMKLSGVTMSAIDRPAETPMLWESKPWADGSRVVAFADGHAKRIPAADWPIIEKSLKWSFPRTAKRPLPSG